jgi:hypothetical protein
MKTKTYLNLLLVASLIFAVVPASSAASAPALSSPPHTIYLPMITNGKAPVLGDLGSISYTLDTARQVSHDFNAGYLFSIMVTDARGYRWDLWVPADALLANQTITMTPFAALEVSQSGPKIVSGVRLEPDGLQFMDAVTLWVTPPDSVSSPGVGLVFSLNQDGSDVSFAPTTNGVRTAHGKIWHFSAAGYEDAYDAGKDVMDQYAKWAEEDYKLALDAANLFIKNGPPTPPTPPSISQFCRGTEVNPEEGEAYEYMHHFIDPYSDIVNVLLGTMKTLALLSDENVDTSGGYLAAQQMMQMADKSILKLGAQYQGEKPPDRLYPVIYTALEVERMLGLVGGSGEINPKVTTWAEVIRDYYLDQLKTNHDYRAFPILLSLEKSTELLGGNDRLADILSALTFEVVVDTSFDAKWIYSEAFNYYESGHVEQTADVKNIKNELNPPDFLWGASENLILKFTKGTLTSHTPAVSGTFPLDPGQSFTGDLWLKNFDACVTKTFDVMFSDFEGIGETFTGFNGDMPVAGTGSRVGFEQYMWGLAGYMFTIPMQNLSPTLGDKSFSGSGSKGGGEETGSAQIHIVIKHTPQ